MKKQDLINNIKKEGIPEDSYSLAGGMPNDRYCMDEVYGKWKVYYSEMGKKYEENYFSTEEEACEYLYNVLIDIFK